MWDDSSTDIDQVAIRKSRPRMAAKGALRPSNQSFHKDINLTLLRNTKPSLQADSHDSTRDEKQVRLSLQSLSEHQTEITGKKHRDSNASLRRYRTTTETSTSTENESRDRAMSMYGISMRAIQVTRRLSNTAFARNLLFDTCPISKDIEYENNFKMEVDKTECFRVGSAKKIIRHMLEVALNGEEYNAEEAAHLCCSVSNNIKNSLRFQQTMPRYKIICHVTIGQKLGQEVRVASRTMWDEEHDNFACVTYENESLFAVAVAFGVYFE